MRTESILVDFFFFIMENISHFNNLIDYLETNSNHIFKFNDYYGLQFISFYSFNNIMDYVSKARANKEITGEEYHSIRQIYLHLYNNEKKIKELISKEPRSIAQKFIGKKNIRNFIIKRDKKCLCCGSLHNLSIDHIVEALAKGRNRSTKVSALPRCLIELQMLNFSRLPAFCQCNVMGSTVSNTIDFKNGNK